MDRADMTHPLTPREKVAVFESCPGCGADEPRNRCLGCRHDFSPGNRQAILDSSPLAALTALASGSGDHAELARLADDLRKFEHHSVGSLKISMDEVRRIIAVCDAHAALLAENAALRAARDDASASCTAWSRTVGEMASIGEGWKERCVEAERNLAEAVGHASWMRNFVPTVWGSTEERLNEIDAFLSKEAERG